LPRILAVSLALVALALGGIALGSPPAAVAGGQETPRLSGPVSDLANAIDSTAEIERAIDELQRESGTQLFVLFVETTGDRDMETYTDDVVRTNNLGGADALLAVAVEDRTYQLWLGDLALDEVSEDEQDTLLAREVEPELADGDFAGAAVAAAGGINAAAGGDVTGGDGDGDGGGGVSTFWLVLIGIGVIGGLALGGWWLFDRWRTQRRDAEERDRRTGELARRANALLLQTDDALRDAEQELAFAEAEFSTAEVTPLREALAGARAQVKGAFTVRQRLDDADPESPAEREKMLQEIVTSCESAQALVAQETRKLEEARDLERRAPEFLQALPAQIDAIAAGAEEAREHLARLQRYAESSWRTVQGNIVEAEKRLAFARAEVEQGQASGREDRQRAAAAVRSSQKALAEAKALLEAIGALATAMQEAQSKLAEQMPAAEADIRSARAALQSGGAPELEQRIALAERALAEARALAGSAQPDVLAAYRLAVEAETAADEVLRTTQEAAEARRRERQTADAAIASADASYRRAAGYVLSRRSGGIGRKARTRLSEAERLLDRARDARESEPREATRYAQSAQRLADDALSLGQEDFGAWGRPGRRGGMDSLGLGVALGGILFGGGGGGFGGTRWGSPGGGMRIPGGFGGGGRSRGGRW
jgi:hypothetical protein